ncbi:MAG: hypothetical protein IJ308_04415 [Clostridia bacterium]|nr:hypothetical protein [Clostridia bacterium]
MAERNSIEIPIYITPVSSGGTGGSGGDMPTPELPDNEQDKRQKQVEEKTKSAANPAAAFARQMAGKVASTALNNYGNITGDYIAGQNLQAAVGEAAAIGTAIALGPAGVAMYAVDKVLQGYNYIAERKRSETEASFAQKRVYATHKKA